MSAPQSFEYYAPSPGQSNDAEHLRLLSIFHYIAGGLLALGGCIPIIHVVLGVLIVTGKFGPRPDPAGYFFIAIGTMFILFCWSLAVCLILSGRFLTQRRNYVFSFVIAVISCLQIPFGTLLGVFTIIVLSRATVKAMYGRP